jgi:hypothetical protein
MGMDEVGRRAGLMEVSGGPKRHYRKKWFPSYRWDT